MFKSLFSDPTSEDLVNEVQKESFTESDADSILEYIDINAIDNEGKTFLHHACFSNKVKPIQWLIRKGIDKDIEDYNGETPLIMSIKNGCFESFHRLLQVGIDVDRQNRYGRTAVQETLLQKNPKFFNAIRNHSKDLNLRDKKGRNLLFDVVLSENISLLKEVLLEDINKTLLDKEGKPAFLLDSVIENINVFKELINDGIDIGLKDKNGNNLLFYLGQSEHLNFELFEYAFKNNIDIHSVNTHGNTILLELIIMLGNLNIEDLKDLKKEEGILYMIEKILEHKIDIDLKNTQGQSALIMAVQQNNFNLVKMLIEYNADIDITNTEGDTGLSIAAIRGKEYSKIIDLLLLHGALIDIKDTNNETIIEKLIDIILHSKNAKKIEMDLLRRINEDTDYSRILTKILSKVSFSKFGLTSKDEPYFFVPVVYENYNLVRLLVQSGADMNQADVKGLNIIYKLMQENKTFDSVASQKKYYDSLKKILEMRVDVNEEDSYGGNTLHKAVLENDIRTVKMLINAHVDMEAKDKQGRNYLHNSVWQDRIQVMRVIHAKNSKLINTLDIYGVLPIQYAAFLGYTDMVLELISLGSRVSNKTRKEPYILEFLKRFHKNVTPMIKNTKNTADQRRIAELVKNMKKEFVFK